MLEINPGLVVWTTVTFILLLIILKKVAWKPLLDALEKREEHIRTSIVRAEQAKKEAENLLEQHRKQIAEIKTEAQKIIDEGREQANKLKSEIENSAKQQARLMINQATQEIDEKKEAALSQLRNEVAGLAVLAAEKILDETLDATKHRRVVDDVLNSFPNN